MERRWVPWLVGAAILLTLLYLHSRGPGIDKGALETQIASQSDASSVSCVGSGRYAFACVVYMADGGTFGVEATCDRSGACVWNRQ